VDRALFSLCGFRKPGIFCPASFERVSFRLVGMWLSLVERCVRDAEVVGSNPAIPTRSQTGRPGKSPGLFSFPKDGDR
jgi:hypothetical protein